MKFPLEKLLYHLLSSKVNKWQELSRMGKLNQNKKCQKVSDWLRLTFPLHMGKILANFQKFQGRRHFGYNYSMNNENPFKDCPIFAEFEKKYNELCNELDVVREQMCEEPCQQKRDDMYFSVFDEMLILLRNWLADQFPHLDFPALPSEIGATRRPP